MLALSGILLGAQLLPEGKGRTVAWGDLTAQVGPLTTLREDHRLFRDRAALRRFLKEARASRPVPDVNFSTRQPLFVTPGPRSSTGYSVEVLSARERDSQITVRVRERAPGLGEDVRPHVTYPYRLISLPAGGDVFVDWVGR